MSFVFELDSEGLDKRIADARLSSFDANQALEPGFFEGALSETGRGIMRGGVKAADFMATMGRMFSPPAATDQEEVLRERRMQLGDEIQDEMRKSALEFWTPRANEVGTAGRVMGALSEMVLPLAAAGGNPSLLIGSHTLDTGKTLVDQGVDARTAGAVAAAEGAGTYVGFKMPFLGKSLAARMATGAAGNLALGAGLTAADREILEARGYEDLAKNYDPLDAESRAIDLLMGVAFGGLAHMGARNMSRSERAAVAAANNAKHFQEDTAPGVLQDIQSKAAHQRAMTEAVEQMIRGEPVSIHPDNLPKNVAPRVEREATVPDDLAEFEANRQAEAVRQVEEIPRWFKRAPSNKSDVHTNMMVQFIEEGRIVSELMKNDPAMTRADALRIAGQRLRERAAFKVEANENLSPEDAAIERKFTEELRRDVSAAEARYSAQPDAKGGKVLNVDTARELSAEYLKDRTKSSAVHEPASTLIKQLYAKKLAQSPKEGELPLVLFTAGGTGAGKTTAITQALGPLAEKAQIVYDTNMNGARSAIQKIDQALAAGKNVSIVYTYRDPIEALTHGALTRAERQAKEFGSGRTVPLAEHLNTHVGSRETIEKIAQHYAGDERVQVSVVDNSQGKNAAKPVNLDVIPKFDPEAYNDLRERAVQTLEQERAAGRISEATFRGFAERASAAESQGVQPPARRGAGDEPQSQLDEGTQQVTRFEPEKSEAPKLGEPFLVARVAHQPGLENANAGNLLSVAGHLMRLEDPMAAQPVGSEVSDTLYVYEVKAREDFGKYAQGSRGKMAGNKLGREQNEKHTIYSFPKGSKYEANDVLAIPLAELRAEVKKIAGTDSFDDMGTRAGAKALEQVIAARMERGSEAPTEPTKPKTTTRSVSTATGRKLEVRPRLVELADIVTSDMPAFPQELQPRQRGQRKELQNQVREIATNLDPARLTDSAEADRGAPITGEGNVVESGNGRVMALKFAYENLPEKAKEYREYLESQGYDTAGMKQPVLVRERVTPLSMDERRAFAVEANQAATAAMSPVERAQADARTLDAGTLSRMRGGDLTSVQNADFVRGFMEQLPQAERNALVNPDGTVSQEGVRRLQSALLAKAYGGNEKSNATLGRMLESTDSDMRSALGAMLDAAPAFARLRQSITEGKVAGEYDIAKHLTDAIENTARLRMSGQSLRDFLAQTDAFTQRAPIVDELMKALYDKTGTRLAGREKIAASLTKYAGQATRQRLDQGSLFAEPPIAPDKLLADAEEPASNAGQVTDMFGLRTSQGPATAAVREMLETQDVRVPTGEIDADGNAVTRSAREVMAEAEAGIAKAEEDAKGIDAAVNCFLTKGFDNAA